uniref:Pre-mRNA-splicing factor SPF27 n=1 Tax=Rhabditophanes sp. KR3021 TaxID=114890 RepID=A0AC35TZ04_9BILA
MLAITGNSGIFDADSERLIDALPYYDTNFADADRKMALELIEAECKIYKPKKNYLEKFGDANLEQFVTPRLKGEMERYERGEPMALLDFSKYENFDSEDITYNDKTELMADIRNAKAFLGHLQIKQTNIELLEQYGKDVCVNFNKSQQEQILKEDVELNVAKNNLMEVHGGRKRSHLEAGEKITDLEQVWVQMVSQNFEMQVAHRDLRKEIAMAEKAATKQTVDEKMDTE